MSETPLPAVVQRTALAVPDPRNQPVPPGWFEREALPAIEGTDDWSVLDEYEARLRAVASYIDSFDGDSVEFEKALRLLEKRRGELLLAGNTHVTGEESKMTASRWRSIASHWDDLWPAIRDATSRADVTQAAVLRRIKMGVHYRSDTDLWSTPQDLFDTLNDEFDFETDVCATAANAKCSRFFTAEDDGLAQEWRGVCWMNPPYGREIADWMRKAHESARDGATVVCLIPARTDTEWWWEHARHGEVRFLRGRLKFGSAESGAPFPSAVVIFGREPAMFCWDR